jgi:hypothetical protein
MDIKFLTSTTGKLKRVKIGNEATMEREEKL